MPQRRMRRGTEDDELLALPDHETWRCVKDAVIVPPPLLADVADHNVGSLQLYVSYRGHTLKAVARKLNIKLTSYCLPFGSHVEFL
jgi:hypothetical protein